MATWVGQGVDIHLHSYPRQLQEVTAAQLGAKTYPKGIPICTLESKPLDADISYLHSHPRLFPQARTAQMEAGICPKGIPICAVGGSTVRALVCPTLLVIVTLAHSTVRALLNCATML